MLRFKNSKYFSRFKIKTDIISLLLVLPVLLGIFLRTYYLREVPIGLYHDELDYVLTGESVARFGTDISGKWVPWNLSPLQTVNTTAELPAVVHAFVQNIFGYGPDSGHLSAALLGIGSCVALGLFVWAITKKKLLGYAAGVSLLINPWHIYISRTGYEAPLSLFFQLLMILGMGLIFGKRTFRFALMLGVVLIASGAFGAFFTYHGAKFVVLALLCCFALISFSLSHFTLKAKLFLATLFISCFALLAGFSLYRMNQGSYGVRTEEVIFNKAYVAPIAEMRRTASVGTPFNLFLSSKPVVIIDEAVRHYLFVFSPYRLFVTGSEDAFHFSLGIHGYFYLSSFIFLPVGMFFLFRNHRKAALLLLLFIIISPVSNIIAAGYQTLFRSALVYALFAGLVGVGVYASYEQIIATKWKTPILSMVLGLMLFEVFWFGINYFTRFPVVTADSYSFDQKLLAGYLSHHSTQDRKVIVGRNSEYNTARFLVAYLQLLPALSMQEREQFISPLSAYQLGSISVTSECPDWESSDSLLLIEAGMMEDCNYLEYLATSSASPSDSQLTSLRSLGSPIDSRSYFYLINDALCTENSGLFTPATSLHDFAVLEMDSKVFCQAWVKEESMAIPSHGITSE